MRCRRREILFFDVMPTKISRFLDLNNYIFRFLFSPLNSRCKFVVLALNDILKITSFTLLGNRRNEKVRGQGNLSEKVVTTLSINHSDRMRSISHNRVHIWLYYGLICERFSADDRVAYLRKYRECVDRKFHFKCRRF